MVYKGEVACDPRGLIYESYRIDGIVIEECRSVFLDWALGTQLGADMGAMLQELLDKYAGDAPDHPMTQVLREGLEKAQRPVGGGRRGGRAARVRDLE